jgi:hypothetical protein
MPARRGPRGRRWIRPHGESDAVFAVDVGLGSRGHNLYVAYMRELKPRGDPIFQAMRHLAGRLVVRTCREVVSDTEWYRSAAWNDYRRPIEIDN